eukprot:scaffold720_cov114-Cylindrotheca_fusiformis.AAC.16
MIASLLLSVLSPTVSVYGHQTVFQALCPTLALRLLQCGCHVGLRYSWLILFTDIIPPTCELWSADTVDTVFHVSGCILRLAAGRVESTISFKSRLPLSTSTPCVLFWYSLCPSTTTTKVAT